jgi:hypothetical protein
MFGLDKISWTQFSLFLLYITGVWYAGLFAWARIIGKKKNKKTLFEYDDLEAGGPKEGLVPIHVKYSDFPREMIPSSSMSDVDLITEMVADNQQDSGYTLDQIAGKNFKNSSERIQGNS